jgi:hypothetical protein
LSSSQVNTSSFHRPVTPPSLSTDAGENIVNFLNDPAFISPEFPLSCDPTISIAQQLHKSALDLLVREDIDISRCCDAYFSVIAPRLPIISKLNFCERVIGIGSKQDATLALLLLSMALVVRPELKPDETNLPGTMYYTAKSVHAVLCSTGQPSLELVQAGNLIAQYEYCQGLFEAATASIWSCATMGYTIGLDKTLNQAFAANSSNRSIVEIGRCVWWHIFTLERYVDRVFIATTPLAPFPWEFHSSYYIT